MESDVKLADIYVYVNPSTTQPLRTKKEREIEKNAS